MKEEIRKQREELVKNDEKLSNVTAKVIKW